MSAPTRLLLGLCVAGLLLGSSPRAAPSPARILIDSEVVLPPLLHSAFDLRWAGDRSVFIASGRAGTFEVPLDAAQSAKLVIPGGSVEGGFWLSSRVAATPSFLVVASPVFAVRWRHRESTRDNTLSFHAILDLDASAHQLLLLGAQKDEKERFAPDGAIAWIGSLTRNLADLRPVYYSSSGPGAKTVDNCGPFDMGAVRFLRDGSFLIVPGVEPGAYLYSAAGKLTRTWDTAQIGLDTGDCEKLESKLRNRLFAQPEPRFAWLNQRRTLDDILALPGDPGLIVRSVAQGRVSWELKLLGREGKVTTIALPIRSNTDLAHLHGDVRGDRIAFLVSEYGKHGPTAPPRLILARITQG